MKQPFAGQTVLFTGKHFLSHSNKNAATVASVTSANLVNLNVINESGHSFGVQGVRYVTAESEIVIGENYCQAIDTALDADNAPVIDPTVNLKPTEDKAKAAAEAGNAPDSAGTSEQPAATPSSPASSENPTDSFGEPVA